MIWLQLFYVYLKSEYRFRWWLCNALLDTGRRGGPLRMDLITGIYRYRRNLTDDTRPDRDQQCYLYRLYSHPQRRLFARDGHIRLLPDDICRLPALFPVSAGYLIRLCQIQEQQICSSRVLRPSSGYSRLDCRRRPAVDEQRELHRL